MVAMKAYDRPSCKTLVEFEEDLGKFSNLVRLCTRDAGEIEAHLIMNAVLTLLNIFDPKVCVKLMFFKVKQQDWGKLKAVLLYLHRMPESIVEIGVVSSEIEECHTTLEILERI